MTPVGKKASNDQNTRLQLIKAAEKLFAEAGIDAVSLRQINIEAGQKNSSAAHYHFGSKDALILAIYHSRMESVNRRRQAALDKIAADGDESNVRRLIEALVYPIVDEIDADKSGGSYIRFMAHAIGNPQLDLNKLWKQEHSDGLVRLLQMLRKALPDVPDPIFGQRFGISFEQIIHSLADRERIRGSASRGAEVNAAIFASNLVDCITGAMSTPISTTTLAELDSNTKTAS